jgi:hypothetical protein
MEKKFEITTNKWKELSKIEQKDVETLYNSQVNNDVFYIRSKQDTIYRIMEDNAVCGFAFITMRAPQIAQKNKPYLYNLVIDQTLSKHKIAHKLMLFIESVTNFTLHVNALNKKPFLFFSRRKYMCNGIKHGFIEYEY